MTLHHNLSEVATGIHEISRIRKRWSVTLKEMEQRHELALQVWEALNTERELDGVLATAAGLLVPVIPFQALAILTFGEAQRGPFALHIVGRPPGMPIGPPPGIRMGGPPGSGRPQGPPGFGNPNAPSRPSIPYSGSELEQRIRAGLPYSCPDLLEQKAWLPHEFRLAAVGLRTYVAIPLTVRGSLIGMGCFLRRKQQPFSSDELTVLSDVSRAIGVAVANALANEQIRKLRDQLEAENIELRSQLGQARGFEEIIGESPALHRVLEAVAQVAPTDATVLITGETGTGKELVARALHQLSPRAQAPLIKVNCAAIPATLIAAELFGHERGAFTGATERRMGRFEQAHGGTLFLDEIGEVPLETQTTLLRVLQEREFERVGGNETVQVNVRLATATNRDLMAAVREGRFRSDLYYRLSVFPIRIPPLRERREDIAPLVAHFANKYAARFGRKIARIDRRTMKALESYSWPGNIRELENVIERAVIVSKNGALRVDREALHPAAMSGDLPADLEARERDAIESALRGTRGRVSGSNGAAAVLGVPASTLESRIRRLGIDKFRYRG